jgi:YidC/Oxa1 family membrane protein insertase
VISNLFHLAFYNPIYNILVALISFVPGGDVGIAVILLTLVIRFILLPVGLSAAHTQRAMRGLEPKLKELKEKHKGDKEKEAVATLELYRTEKVNPFMSFITLLIQIPVLLALYWVFRYEPFTTLDLARLYAFTPHPSVTSLEFLGVINVMGKSLVLAFLAGATQYAQAVFALSGAPTPAAGGSASQDFTRMMNSQIKYFFPVMIAVIAYSTSSAIALYFITTNIFGTALEWYVRRRHAANIANAS